MSIRGRIPASEPESAEHPWPHSRRRLPAGGASVAVFPPAGTAQRKYGQASVAAFQLAPPGGRSIRGRIPSGGMCRRGRIHCGHLAAMDAQSLIIYRERKQSLRNEQNQEILRRWKVPKSFP